MGFVSRFPEMVLCFSNSLQAKWRERSLLVKLPVNFLLIHDFLQRSSSFLGGEGYFHALHVMKISCSNDMQYILHEQQDKLIRGCLMYILYLVIFGCINSTNGWNMELVLNYKMPPHDLDISYVRISRSHILYA